MKKTILYAAWGGMFLLCALLGAVYPDQTGAIKWVLITVGILFFLPPGWLLWLSWREKDRKTLKLLRLISLVSLGLSLVLMVANILSVLSDSALLGQILYMALAVLGTPMACCQGPYISLFLWAALLFTSIELLKEAKQ